MISDYRDLLREAYPTYTDLQIEHLCVRDMRVQKEIGTDQNFHRRQAMKLMFPHRVEHPWRVRMINSWGDCRRDKIREIIWIGSAMSNKTGSLGDLFLELLWENPANTTIMIASPYQQATRGRLWAEIVKSFQIAQSLHPHLPGEIKKSAGRIEVSALHIRSGIEMVSVDDHAKLIGGNNDDVTSGNFILGVDEAPNLPNGGAELLSGMKNMRMRPSFTGILVGNFAEVTDCLGTAGEPDLPGGYEALDVDTSHEWNTTREGRVYRFDGMQSPNVLAKRDDMPFLTRWDEVKTYIDKGQTDSADFYRWVRSFPVLGHDSKTVLTMPAIRANRGLETPEYTSDPLIRGGACDPGFGGDACLLGEWCIGWEWVKGERVQVLEFPGAPIEVPLRVRKGMSSETVNAQIVEFAKIWAEKRKIPARNFGFDGSMRAGIVQQFMRDFSVETVAIDFGGTATDRRMSSNTPKTWKDEAANFVTELWLAFQQLVEGGQARGMQNHEDAVRQLCARWWRWSGKRKQIETKDEYKSRHSYKSPNEADMLVIGLEMARRRGFSLRGVVANGGGAMHELLKMQQSLAMRAYQRQLSGNALPMGHLRGMESGSERSRHGRLRNS